MQFIKIKDHTEKKQAFNNQTGDHSSEDLGLKTHFQIFYEKGI